MQKRTKQLARFTLLCFLLTLIPMTGFAATVDAQQCQVFTEDTSARTGENVTIQFSFDGQLDKAGVATPTVYVWFIKDGSNVPSLSVTSVDGFSKDNIGIFTIPASSIAEGREYNFQFANTGRYYVEAALGNPAALNGSTAEKIRNVDYKMLSEQNTVGVETASAVSRYKIIYNGRTYENGAAIRLNGLTANNIDQEIKLKIVDQNGKAVPKAKVRIEANSSNLTFDKSSQRTDQIGQVTFRVSTGRTGDYQIYVTCSAPSSQDEIQNPQTTPDTSVDNHSKKVLMTIGSTTFAVNGKQRSMDTAPLVTGNRTYVPFRALAEAFGAQVRYQQTERTIVATWNNTTVQMTIDATTFTVNGTKKTVQSQ